MFPRVDDNTTLWALESTWGGGGGGGGERKRVSRGTMEKRGQLGENEAVDRGSNTFLLSIFQQDAEKLRPYMKLVRHIKS